MAGIVQFPSFSICEGADRSPVCPGSLARNVRPYSLVCDLDVIKETCVTKPPVQRVNPCDPKESPADHIVSPCKPKLCLKPCPLGDVCSPCYAIANHRVEYRSILNPCAPCPPCPRQPLVNCTPNLPPMPCGGSAWKPLPPAKRGTPATQSPQTPSPVLPCRPCPPHGQCLRECAARDLKLPRSDYKLNLCMNCPRECLAPCNGAPPVTVYTCGTEGRRKLNDRITTYYSYPGYVDVEGGINAVCHPRIPCRQNTGHRFKEAARQPVQYTNLDVTPPRGIWEVCDNNQIVHRDLCHNNQIVQRNSCY